MFVIDSAASSGDAIQIHGWSIDPMQENKIAVTDGNGQNVQADISRFMRQDVNQSQEVPAEDYKAGFRINIQKEKLRTRKIYIVFENTAGQSKYRLDTKKITIGPGAFKQRLQLFSKANRAETKKNIQTFGLWDTIRYNYGQGLEYERWYRKHRLTPEAAKSQRETNFPYAPLISIVIPLYNTPEKFLREIIDSLLNQTYGKLELCLADASDQDNVQKYIETQYGKEKRIQYKRLIENGGISDNTNAALAMATGEFIMLSDHDDILELDALFEIVSAINRDGEIDVLYSDEDKVDLESRVHFQPHFKSDFNIDMLRGNNYITHIFVVKKTLLERVGDFRREFDGAQDYDLILRCCEQAQKIHHIPKALYHWRAHPNSTAENPESKMYAYVAGQKALQEHLNRMGIEAEVSISKDWGRYDVDYKIQGNPLISIIIPNKDHIEDLEKCMSSIREKSTWKNYEFVIAENNSEDPATFAYYEKIKSKYSNVKVVYWKEGFNYSAINNFAVREAAQGDYYLFLNNDVEVIAQDWMEQMLAYCQRSDVGIVGAKLYYPDNTIQHAGVIIGYGGFAGHIFIGYPRDNGGYMSRANVVHDLSAVTAACMMVDKRSFMAVGGFDEDFVVALNDVDLCLKVRKLGKLVVYNPKVELYHYESKSRGYEDTQEKQERFQKEVDRFKKKWNRILKTGDPYYNINLSLNRADCALKQENEE